jgi:hypothetical protein
MPMAPDSMRFSTATEIALAFGRSGTPSGSGWHDFRCPAHDDKTASCGIKDERMARADTLTWNAASARAMAREDEISS